MRNGQKVKFITGLTGLCLAFTGIAIANLPVQNASAETVTSTASKNDFWMEDGASIRAVKDSSGIRWETNVSKTWYDSLFIPETATVEFRTLVTSAKNVTSIDELTYDFSTQLKDIPCATEENIFWKNDLFTYYGSILYGNLTEEEKVTAFATELISRSYVKVTNGENISIYYANANDTARSIRAVAKEAVEDTEMFNKLTSDAQTAVKEYLGTKNDKAIALGENVYQTSATNTIENTDYKVAYLGAKKVGTVDGTTITLTDTASFELGETYELTLFDAKNNYAQTAPFKYVTDTISTKEELEGFFTSASTDANKYYVLTSNIDYENSVITRATNVTGLAGTFDGLGHTISNVIVNDQGGMFAMVTGTIKNVAFVGIESQKNGGNLLCSNSSSTTVIDNVYVKGSFANTQNGWAVARLNAGGAFRNCIFETTHTTASDARIFDARGGATISNCYAIGSETKPLYYESGTTSAMVVNSNAYSSMSSCLDAAATNITATNGWSEYWSINENRLIFGGNIVSWDIPEVKPVKVFKVADGNGEIDLSTLIGEKTPIKLYLNGSAIEIPSNNVYTVAVSDYKLGNINNLIVYDGEKYVKQEFVVATDTISTKAELKTFFETNVTSDKYYVLTTTIDYENGVVTRQGSVTGLAGTFDGLGHTISNVIVKEQGGMFGTMTGTIKNVAFVNIESQWNGGNLLCSNSSSTTVIDNVYVKGSFTNSGNIWGVARLLNGGAFRNCIFESTHTTTSSDARIFDARGGATISNCYAIGREAKPLYYDGSATTSAMVVNSKAYSSMSFCLEAATTNITATNGWSEYWSVVKGSLYFGETKIN